MGWASAGAPRRGGASRSAAPRTNASRFDPEPYRARTLVAKDTSALLPPPVQSPRCHPSSGPARRSLSCRNIGRLHAETRRGRAARASISGVQQCAGWLTRDMLCMARDDLTACDLAKRSPEPERTSGSKALGRACCSRLVGAPRPGAALGRAPLVRGPSAQSASGEPGTSTKSRCADGPSEPKQALDADTSKGAPPAAWPRCPFPRGVLPHSSRGTDTRPSLG